MASQLFVVVVGCGQVGAVLATQMSARGDSVVVVDRDERAFAGLSSDYTGFKFDGDATEIETLRQANTAKADLLIATTSDDNVNILIALIAQRLIGVPRVLARISNIRRQIFYDKLDIEAFSPTAIVARHFLEHLDNQYTDNNRDNTSNNNRDNNRKLQPNNPEADR